MADAALEAALAECARGEPAWDASALRSVRAEVRRSLYLPQYEDALEAASAETQRDAILSQLERAKRAAEEMGNLDDVRWIDQMIQGPKLQENLRAGSEPATSDDPNGRARGSRAGGESRQGLRAREEQKEQFKRVARNSRTYAAKRLRTKP